MRRCFQGAAHQRCRVHFARNLLALIPKSYKGMVAALFRTIFVQPDRDAVSQVWEEVREQLVKTFPNVGPLMDAGKAEVLAFTAFLARAVAALAPKYAAHYNTARPHRALRLRPPRPTSSVPAPVDSRIRRRPILGGLLNEYETAA